LTYELRVGENKMKKQVQTSEQHIEEIIENLLLPMYSYEIGRTLS